MDEHTGGAFGYPAMAPLPGTPDDPSPDYLLRVDTASRARAALEADKALIVPDGRSTAWAVAARVLWGSVVVAVIAVSLEGQATSPPMALVLGAGLLVTVVVGFGERAAGVTPASRPLPVTWLLGAGLTVVVLAFALRELSGGAMVAAVALGVAVAAAEPVVRWVRARGRPAPGPPVWPPGAEAFALLSVLARVESIAPARLELLTGLDRAATDSWLDRLRTELSLTGGCRRHRLVGDQRVAITVPGEQRRARMRRDLERLASAVDVLDRPDQP